MNVCMYECMYAWLARCDVLVDLTAIMETNYIHISTGRCTYIPI